MMTQTNNLIRFKYIQSLHSTIIELPYGDYTDASLTNNRFSMLLIYPHVRLSAVFRALQRFNIARIVHAFSRDKNNFREITITLPKFEIDSNFNVKTQLEQLGVVDAFNPNLANLSKMFSNRAQRPYLSDVIHMAQIQVNEFGTVASAATVVRVNDRSGFRHEINFNRPFGFLIVDQVTNSILFAGQVKNPIG